jgi:hypothetical protein
MFGKLCLRQMLNAIVHTQLDTVTCYAVAKAVHTKSRTAPAAFHSESPTAYGESAGSMVSLAGVGAAAQGEGQIAAQGDMEKVLW